LAPTKSPSGVAVIGRWQSVRPIGKATRHPRSQGSALGGVLKPA
jgi:hypothetical protein